MPFIGPKVREQSGRLIPAGSARQVSGRCGHRPLREFGDFTIQLSQASTFRCPLHTRPGTALPPSPRRGFFPSSGPGTARSTFPVGEGCLRRGWLPTGRSRFYPRSGSPAALRQRTRREPSFTAIRALFSVKWLLTPRGKPGVNTPWCSS